MARSSISHDCPGHRAVPPARITGPEPV